MAIKDWFKPKEPEELKVPEYAQSKPDIKKETLPPVPRKQTELTIDDLAKGIQELSIIIEQTTKNLANNQKLIYELLIAEEEPDTIVLSKEELKYVPEKDKDEYMEIKKTKPKVAKVMLQGYKADKAEDG